MYTNGLKDRYGSPLLSLDVGDDRYVVKGEIEYSNKRIDQKLNVQDKIIEHHTNKIVDLYDKSHHTNVQLSEHVQDDVIHFSSEEKDSFNDLFIRLDGIKGYTHQTIPYNETTGDNGGEAFRITASRLPIGKEIDEIIVPTRNSPSVSFYMALYIIASSEPVESTNKTLLAISDNKITWTSGNDAVWTFGSKPVIPKGYDLEIHVGTSESDFTATGTTYRSNGNNELKCRYKQNATGQGACRYQTVWHSNRAIRIFFKKNDIQGHIGDDTHLTSEEKTEVQNLVNGVYLTGDDLDNKLGYLYNVVSNPTDYHNVNAINAVSATIPHNVVFDEIRIPAYNTSTDSYYLAIWSVINGTKTYIGHSDSAISWKTNEDAVWTFRNTPFSIPSGANLEMFLAASLDDIQSNTTNPTSEHILCMYKGGSGSVRWQSGWVHGRDTQVILRKAGHIADETHLTDRQIGAIQGVIDGNYVTNETAQNFVTKEELDNIKTKEQYYDTWTNLIDGDITDKADSYSFQLAKDDFVTGKIDRIEIPYVKGTNSNGYLCVEFFDSSNNVIATYYSNNKQKQDKTGDNDRGLCEFEFNTFETPETYSHVRFALVQYTWTVPTGNSGLKLRIVPIKRNNTFTWNTNEKTRINNTGTRWTVLLSVLTRNYAKNTGISVRNYDWTPDVFCPINVTLAANGSVFVAPTNGWIISKSSQTTSGANSLKLNGIEIAKSSNTSQADMQILMRKGEFIGADTAYTLVFYPCKSEQFDYRLDGGHTMYDIWKGAVVYDEFGQPTVKDLYVPDASAWKSEVGSSVIGRIATISDEVAYDASGNFLFNIQSQHIENGKGLLVGSTITSWNTSLANLRIGEQMFGYSAINTWTTALPLMWKGDSMFYGCSQLTTFNASLPALTSGWHMFTNCSSLSNVTIGSLVSLTDGTNMFKGCSLSYTSLNNILNALPTRNGNVIEITVADSVKDDMLNDSQWQGVTIPAYNSSNYYEFTHNGWNVRLTSRTGFSVINETEYDISEANGNTQVTGEWYLNVVQPAGLNIVRVIDGVAYDE